MRRLFGGILLLFALGTMSGQNFNNTACPTVQTEYLRHFAVGTTGDLFTISGPTGPGGVSSWGLVDGHVDCGTGIPDAGSTQAIGGNIQAVFNGNQVTINAGAGAGAMEEDHAFTLRATVAGTEYYKHYRLIVRKPVELVFVMDRSGSMDCDPLGANCGSAGANSRWRRLTAALGQFVAKLDNAQTLASDRFNLVYFDGNTGYTTVNDSPDFRTVGEYQDAGTGIAAELGGITPNGSSTSVGAGILKAFQRHGGEDADLRQVIFLFTDGQQNDVPWLRSTAGTGYGRVIEESKDAAEVLNLDAAANDDIEIYVGASVETGDAPMLLQSLAKGSNRYKNTQSGGNFIQQITGEVFNAVYGANSPRYVDVRRFPLQRNQPISTSFTVNRGVNRMLFDLYFSSPGIAADRTLQVSIKKDGTVVTTRAVRHSNEYVQSFIFPFSRLDTMSSEGEWTVEVQLARGAGVPPNTEITIAATADDHDIRFAAGTEEDKLIVNESFVPTLELFENGEAVTNATVTATILEPGDDLGDVLARTNISPVSIGSGTSTCAESKYAALLQTNAPELQLVQQISRKQVKLNHQQNGKYLGLFGGGKVTGNYKIRYDISYTSPRLGEVRRMEEQTRYVTFPPLNLARKVKKGRGEIGLQDGLNQQKSSAPLVVITPQFTVNGKTRFVGPGFGTAIGTRTKNVKVSAADNCNGSYNVRVEGPGAKKFDLYLTDQLVYRGSVNRFNGKGGLQLGLYAGRTLPRAELDSLFDPGLYGELGLGAQLFGPVGLEVRSGYYGFDPDFNVLGGTAYLNASLGGGSTHLVVGAGPGYYFPKNQDGRLGVSARARLEQEFGNLTLGVEGGYFRLTDPELEYATLGLALRFSL